ncbi:MAG: hypothetical protein R3F56_07380 [Planctomycetota bacterium]
MVRIERGLAQDPDQSTELMRKIAALLASGASGAARPADGANPCDDDPNCDYLGEVKLGNMTYLAYDCDGDVALYPV